MKKRRVAAMMITLAMLLSGCTSGQSGTESGGTDTEVSQETSVRKPDEKRGYEFKKKDFYTDFNKTKCTKIKLDGESIRIVRGGNYLLSGTLEDGQIVVEADETEDVRLVLNGVDIHSENGPAIYAVSCDKLIVSLPPDTVSSLSDRTTVTDENGDELNGCIFCRDNLTFNGSGTLNIEADAKDGIVCKDRLIFMEGNYNIKAADDAVIGKEELIVRDGCFTLTSGGDGMKSTEKTDEKLGYILLMGGEYRITAEGDAVCAETDITIEDGSFTVTAGGGCENAEKHQKTGGFDLNTWDPDREAEPAEDTVSRKGLKAGRDIILNGGTLELNTADDTVHAGGNVVLSGGALTVSSGDDALSAEKELLIGGGALNIRESWEGLEAARIRISGGTVSLRAQDDGVNATGDSGTDPDPFAADETALFSMSGGVLSIDTPGDGIDSNGDLTLTGGTLDISGPSSDGDGYFDATGTFTLTGGKVIAVGSYGMIKYPDTIGQAYTAVTGLDGEPGDQVSLRDADGTEIMSVSAKRAYGSVFVSDPALKVGETYSVCINDTEAEKAEASDTVPESWQKNGPGGNRPPGEGMNPPGEGMNPPGEGMNPPGEGMIPPEEGMNSPGEGNPPAKP